MPKSSVPRNIPSANMGSMPVEPVRGIKIAIDRGGTFTDIWATAPGQPDLVFKLLSVDPSNYADAPTEGESAILPGCSED